MGIKFREDFYWEVFKLATFFTNAKNEKLKTRENKYITILITNCLMRLSMTKNCVHRGGSGIILLRLWT